VISYVLIVVATFGLRFQQLLVDGCTNAEVVVNRAAAKLQLQHLRVVLVGGGLERG
jgi:hypothetical protein